MRRVESVSDGNYTWDKFAIYANDERSKFKLRWWDQEQRRQRSITLEATNLVAARAAALSVVATIISPVSYIQDKKDPLFAEIWPAWEAHRAEHTTIERQILLRSRWHNYYRDRLGSIRCSKIEEELRKFRDELLEHGKPWKGGIKTSTLKGKLSPNTIQEIIDTPRRAVCYAIRKRLVTEVPEPDLIHVAGYQPPKERAPKGRYVSFAEMGRMIDNSGHNLDELLLECGCAARIGAIADLLTSQVHLRAGIIDLLPPGASQTTKGRPLVPISGPMWWVLRNSLARQVTDRHVILYRSEESRRRRDPRRCGG